MQAATVTSRVPGTGKRLLLWTGIAAFVTSFFLIAVQDDSLRGWQCAWITLAWMWRSTAALIQEKPIAWIATVLSGLVSPAFLIAISMILWNKFHRLARILSVTALVLVPATWVVFHYYNLVPREGYYLWVGSMLLIVIPDEVTRIRSKKITKASDSK